MNLRLSPGAVRVRVSRSELDQLLSTGELSASTQLTPHLAYTYSVLLDDAAASLLLEAEPTGLRLRLSAAQAALHWPRACPARKAWKFQQADGRGILWP